jgi:glycogen operon protein
MHLIMNAYWEPLDFELPSLGPDSREPWRRWIDTALDAPHDIAPWRAAPAVPPGTYRAEARSVVVLYVYLDPSHAARAARAGAPTTGGGP